MSKTDCATTEDHGCDTAHQDSVLIAELATVNTLLARYVLRYTDAEANRATPIPIADEYALANRVAAAADAIRARAQRRDLHECP
jgi:hypothetical protein